MLNCCAELQERGDWSPSRPRRFGVCLGANALDPEAVQRIFEAKGRPVTSPLIVHVAQHLRWRGNWRSNGPVASRKLARRFWPGPLTIILPKKPTRASTS